MRLPFPDQTAHVPDLVDEAVVKLIVKTLCQGTILRIEQCLLRTEKIDGQHDRALFAVAIDEEQAGTADAFDRRKIEFAVAAADLDIGGAEVEPGSTITLTVSTGPGEVSVPDLSGRTESQARADLVDAGLVVGTVTPVDNASEPAGTVVTQNPSAGTTVPPDTAVSFEVSSGRVEVPNVVGLTQSQAQNALAGRGLAWLPCWMVSKEIHQGKLVPLLKQAPEVRFDVHAVWRQTPHLPLRVRIAIDTLASRLPSVMSLDRPEPTKKPR